MKKTKNVSNSADEFSQLTKRNSKRKNVVKKIDKTKPFIGGWEDAHKFTQDNEYVIKGYRINFNSIKKTFKSLFMVHNESMNIWLHLFGVLLFISFVVYIAIWLSPLFTSASLDSIEDRLHIKVDQTDIEEFQNNTLAK